VEEEHDHVERILSAWARERPDLDVTPVAVFGRISRIEHFKDRRLRDVYRRHGLDSGEYDVLAALRRSGPDHQLTPTALYRALLVTSATMTERLDRLERRGLIARHPAPNDRRSVLVKLTAPGRELIEHAQAELVEAEAALLAGLSAAERTALVALLARLASQLERAEGS
jgi:DNA-binding MarR family transcriptional regulator